MKTNRLVTFMLLLCMLLSSCSSVYIDPNKPNQNKETTSSSITAIDNVAKEYFTSGEIYRAGNTNDGFFYNGFWIYIEDQIYNDIQIYRLVKANPITGMVSSVCLDPVCNHSPNSNCIMIGYKDSNNTFGIVDIIEDWLIFTKSHTTIEYGWVTNTYFYNLKTGESFLEFESKLDVMVMERWTSINKFDGKFYKVRKILDYSGTGYEPNGDVPASEFTPLTKQIVYTYEIKTRKLTELCEIPGDYGLVTVSNQRLFLKSPDGKYFTCKHDGTDLQLFESWSFSPENKINTYAYDFIQNGFKIFDLKTNTESTFTISFTCLQNAKISTDGIVFNTFTTIDEWAEKVKETSNYLQKYGQGAYGKYLAECDSVKYSGKAQLWRTGFEGGEPELIYELDNAVIEYVYSAGDYIYAYVKRGDPQKNFSEMACDNNGRCIINIKTGEIKNIPYLEIISSN